METPDLAAIDFGGEFRDVYEPAEDSFLMLDALESDLQQIGQLK